MRTKTVQTDAEGVKYTVTVQQFESLEEAITAMEGGADAVLSNLNSLQEQNGKQGDKTRVRQAIRTALAREAGLDTDADGFDPDAKEIRGKLAAARQKITDDDLLNDPDVAEAIAKHQESASKYVLGKTRQSSGGVTQKTKQSIGDRVVQYITEHGKPPSQAELARIMEELNVKQ